MQHRLLLTDTTRINLRDDKLWEREKRRATLYGFQRIACPCNVHKGTGLPFQITEIRKHLIRYGRSVDCRIWRGPDPADSSDEEWEAEFASRHAAQISRPQPRDSGLEVREMIQDIYQQMETFSAAEDTINSIAMSALEESDAILGVNADTGTPEDLHTQGQDGDGNTGTNRSTSTSTGDPDHSTEHSDTDLPRSMDGTDLDEHGFTQNTGTCSGEIPQRNTVHGDTVMEGGRTVLDTDKLEEERMKDVQALEDAMVKLFDGSNHSKLAATVMVVNLVATHPGITNQAADDILATFKTLLPTDNCMPGSLYHAKTLTKRLGLDFRNIDGCINGCTLFDLEETKHLDRCPKCSAGRYRDMQHRIRPLKVLRQFRIIPRLQRFYRIPVLAKLMRWYKENLSSDGKVRYPADSRAWKKLDTMDPQVFDTGGFGIDERDVRMQISCDGICPFKLHKSTWSAWPVLASFLNLPPWLITKKFFTILTLLIPGRSQVPFEHFDVWIRPLLDELKELWVGVPAYDILKSEGQRAFKLRAAVLYTTHDFPGYGTVSGAAHQGYAACPPCGNQLKGKYAYESKKMTYRDARRWLRPDHFMRSSRFDKFFNGESERRLPPTAKTAAQQLEALRLYHSFLSRGRDGSSEHTVVPEQAHADVYDGTTGDSVGNTRPPEMHVRTGGARAKAAPTANLPERRKRSNTNIRSTMTGQRHSETVDMEMGIDGSNGQSATTSTRTRKRSGARVPRLEDPSKIYGMKRRSGFFDLPYWEHLEIRNSLDIMHCEKNLAENLLKTICGVKEKDSVKVRRDMEREGIRKHLWMTKDPNNSSRMLKPLPNYVLTPREFNLFCTRLEKLKVPSEYCSDIGSHIRNKKFGALKSHDYHILMQTLLPLALRGLMDQNTRMAIMRVCRLFRRLCCKVWDPLQEDNLREDVAVTMCLVEMTFPPTFFDIMSHLPMHLVEELIILGPTQVRWMYPVERTMMTLKNHVKNRARPEASIAHGYLMDETMGFATSYMHGFDVVRRRVWDADPEDCAEFEVLQGAPADFILTRAQRDSIHKFVLCNNTLTASFYRDWEKEWADSGGAVGPVETWIKAAVHSLKLDMSNPDDADTVLLCNPPSLLCKKYAKMSAYGNHWRIDNAKHRSLDTYDCGVACMEASEQSSGSGINYVGVLEDILLLDYGDTKTPIIVFSCQWKRRYDNLRRDTYLRDADGFLVVNFKYNTPKSIEPYVFPSQCSQVFFSDDDLQATGSQWKVVLRKEARSRRKVEEDDDAFITSTVHGVEDIPRGVFQNHPEEPDLAGAILLNEVDNALALQGFERRERRKVDGNNQPGRKSRANAKRRRV